MSTSPLAHTAAEALEGASFLDAPGQAIGSAIRDNVPPVAKNLLSGTWLGHTLHPLLTDVVIGTWTSAVLLDFLGGRDSEKAARRLLAVGLASAPPTFLSGWTDWADTEPGSPAVRRSGLVHAATNGLGAVAMAASLKARHSGRTGRGKLLSLAGISALSLGGWIGGHLGFARGVGVDTNALENEIGDWTRAAALSDLPEGRPRSAVVEGRGIFLLRRGDRVHALADRCSHRGGALSEGELGEDTITCPLHGSCFRLEDGSVARGPAAYPQPVYETRVVDGSVEIRRSAPTSFVASK